jgi:hypothetical protein
VDNRALIISPLEICQADSRALGTSRQTSLVRVDLASRTLLIGNKVSTGSHFLLDSNSWDMVIKVRQTSRSQINRQQCHSRILRRHRATKCLGVRAGAIPKIINRALDLSTLIKLLFPVKEMDIKGSRFLVVLCLDGEEQ